MSFNNSLAYGLTGLSLIAGAMASLKTSDWTWFSRSGAAVVAIGIVLTSRQVFEHSRRLQEHQRKLQTGGRPASPGNFAPDWADDNSIRQLIRARALEEERWKSEFSGFYMLVSGTLVWGFGDLLGLVFS